MRNGPSCRKGDWGRHSNAPSRGRLTGARINTPSDLPFPCALEGGRFTFFGGLVSTWEPTPGRRHISVGTANPTVRTRKQRGCDMQRRRSSAHTFEDRIAAEKACLEAQLAKLKPGPQMDGLLKKISQLETAANINEWLTSPGLQPPKSA